MRKMSEVFELPLTTIGNWLIESTQERCATIYLEQHASAAAHAINHVDALAEALEELFDDYKQLSDSGDAGNLSIEKSSVGMKAIAALAAYRGEV